MRPVGIHHPHLLGAIAIGSIVNLPRVGRPSRPLIRSAILSDPRGNPAVQRNRIDLLRLGVLIQIHGLDRECDHPAIRSKCRLADARDRQQPVDIERLLLGKENRGGASKGERKNPNTHTHYSIGSTVGQDGTAAGC